MFTHHFCASIFLSRSRCGSVAPSQHDERPLAFLFRFLFIFRSLFHLSLFFPTTAQASGNLLFGYLQKNTSLRLALRSFCTIIPNIESQQASPLVEHSLGDVGLNAFARVFFMMLFLLLFPMVLELVQAAVLPQPSSPASDLAALSLGPSGTDASGSSSVLGSATSLASILEQPTGHSLAALEDVFNGINVEFPSFSDFQLPDLASVSSRAAQLLPTATGTLQAIVTSILENLNPGPSVSSLGTSGVILNASTTCPGAIIVTPLNVNTGSGTPITIQPACGSSSNTYNPVQLSSVRPSAASQLLPSLSFSNNAATTAVNRNASALPTTTGSVGLIGAPSALPFRIYNTTQKRLLGCADASSGGAPVSAVPITACVLNTTSVSIVATAALLTSAPQASCTTVSPGATVVTCLLGPDASSLFCPQGCPTTYSDQCAFICTSLYGRTLGGLVRALQCAVTDLGLISPGVISCRKCQPQCITANSSNISAATPLTSSSNATASSVSICKSCLISLDLRVVILMSRQSLRASPRRRLVLSQTQMQPMCLLPKTPVLGFFSGHRVVSVP